MNSPRLVLIIKHDLQDIKKTWEFCSCCLSHCQALALPLLKDKQRQLAHAKAYINVRLFDISSNRANV